MEYTRKQGERAYDVQGAGVAGMAEIAAACAIKFTLAASAYVLGNVAEAAAKSAYMCRMECSRLAKLLTNGKVAAYLQRLDRLAEADGDVWDDYLQLCDLLEEAHCLVLTCKATTRFSVRRRFATGQRITELRQALAHFGGSAALDRVKAAQDRQDARGAATQMAAEGQTTNAAVNHVPALASQGPLHGTPSLQLPEPVEIFQHMRDFVPKLQGVLPRQPARGPRWDGRPGQDHARARSL